MSVRRDLAEAGINKQNFPRLIERLAVTAKIASMALRDVADGIQDMRDYSSETRHADDAMGPAAAATQAEVDAYYDERQELRKESFRSELEVFILQRNLGTPALRGSIEAKHARELEAVVD